MAYATPVSGNCLFNALSDQLYGHQNEHAAIRSRVIDYMRAHAEYYKQFIDVYPGGGIRRNPKRKNAGAYSSPTNAPAPSEADIDRVFESHLQRMAKGGTYGDNMEITAFSSAYDVDVKIYQRDFAYMVTGGGGAEDSNRPVAHIAYHIWEHYSSIRNLDGPHSGRPAVSPKLLSPEEEAKQREKLAQTPHVQPWQIDVVSKSLPFLADKPAIKRALEAARGDVNLAVSNLLDAEEYGSTSQPESSSVERDQDSDDDAHAGPNKKQDRRMSRASRAQKLRTNESKHALSHLATYDGSQESIDSFESEASSMPEGSRQSTQNRSNAIEDSETRKKEDEDSAAPSRSPERKPIKLKLLPPRPPDQALRAGKTVLRQPGPARISTRDRKSMKKQAQKAARKERAQTAVKGGGNRRTESPSAAGLALRQKGMTETPPVTETLRTLYI